MKQKSYCRTVTQRVDGPVRTEIHSCNKAVKVSGKARSLKELSYVMEKSEDSVSNNFKKYSNNICRN